jgi:hypothetical protein
VECVKSRTRDESRLVCDPDVSDRFIGIDENDALDEVSA